MINNSPQLTVRKLEVDIDSGFERHWHSGDAFLSQYYNALSMSFPVGEQSFIDAVRESAKLLPETPEYAELRTTVAQFIGQEATHKAVAYDVYNALGGNYKWRIRWYLYVLVLFSVDAIRQTTLNLWHDGSLFKPSTWWSAAKFLFGKDGFVWTNSKPLLAYFKRDFHPNDDPFGDNQQLAANWLQRHAQSWRAVQ